MMQTISTGRRMANRALFLLLGLVAIVSAIFSYWHPLLIAVPSAYSLLVLVPQVVSRYRRTRLNTGLLTLGVVVVAVIVGFTISLGR